MTDDEANERAKLLMARQELIEVLKKYDLVGYMATAGRYGRSEAISHLEASWFNLRMVQAPDGQWGIRMVSRLADYGGDKDAKHRDLVSTGGAFSSIAEILARSGYTLLSFAAKIDEVLSAEHTPLQPDDNEHPH